jgi:hypothetical protein
MKHISQDSWSPSQDSIQASAKYEPGALPLYQLVWFHIFVLSLLYGVFSIIINYFCNTRPRFGLEGDFPAVKAINSASRSPSSSSYIPPVTSIFRKSCRFGTSSSTN